MTNKPTKLDIQSLSESFNQFFFIHILIGFNGHFCKFFDGYGMHYFHFLFGLWVQIIMDMFSPAYQENVNKLLTKPCRVKWKNHFLLAGLLFLNFSWMTVAARIVALSNQVIPCAGVVHFIAFLHLLYTAARGIISVS